MIKVKKIAIAVYLGKRKVIGLCKSENWEDIRRPPPFVV